MSPARARVLCLALPPLLFLALHLRSLDYDFIWTDHAEIQREFLIRPPGTFGRAFVEPVTLSQRQMSAPEQAPYYRPLPVVVLLIVIPLALG